MDYFSPDWGRMDFLASLNVYNAVIIDEIVNK